MKANRAIEAGSRLGLPNNFRLALKKGRIATTTRGTSARTRVQSSAKVGKSEKRELTTQRTFRHGPAKFYKGMIGVSIYDACPRMCPGKLHQPNYEMEQELFKFQAKIESKFEVSTTKNFKFPLKA